MQKGKIIKLFILYSLFIILFSSCPGKIEKTDNILPVPEIKTSLTPETKQELKTGTIIGKVTSGTIKITAENEQGVENARVYIERSSIETITDKDGSFTLNNVPAGNHAVVAEKASNSGENFKLRKEITIKTGETLDLKSLLIKKTGVIFGMVKLENKTSVLGTDVFISGSTIIAKTDEEGNFTILDVPEGKHTISATKVGYKNIDVVDIIVESGKGTQVPTITLIEDKEALKRGGILTGNITANDNKPLGEVTISLKRKTSSEELQTTNMQSITISGNDGKYELGGIGKGDYECFLFKTGFLSKTFNVTIEEGKTNTQNIILQKTEKLNEETTGSITGVVKDKTDKLLEKIIIKTNPVTKEATTDKDGKFELLDIPEGTYTVIAMKESEKIGMVYATVGKKQTVTLEIKQKDKLTPIALPTIEPTPTPTPTLSSAPTISGIILNSASTTIHIDETVTFKVSATMTDGSPISEITWISSNPSVATVDDNGTVKGISEGTTIITATPTKFPSKSVSVLVSVKSKK